MMSYSKSATRKENFTFVMERLEWLMVLRLGKYFVCSQLLCNKTSYNINALFRVVPICQYCKESLLQTPHKIKENKCHS